MNEYVLADIKGSSGSLDPRSKIVTTVICITGVAISLDYHQILLYLLIYIPLLILFKPRLVFLKRIIIPIIFMVLFAVIFYFTLEAENITLYLVFSSREYNRVDFVLLFALRYIVIILFNYMLLHSEDTNSDIIEALASFKLGKTIITLLLLIKRISIRVLEDYQKMLLAAESKGAISKRVLSKKTIIDFSGIIKNTYTRLRILGRTIARSIKMSENISRTLTARGFHDTFQPTIRPWSSEGITVLLLSFVFFINITLYPWL